MRVFANLLATSAICLLAAEAAETVDNIFATIATLTPSGVLIWYLWYTQTKTFPDMVREHKAELMAVQAGFVETLSEERKTRVQELREAFASTLKSERALRIDELRAISICRFPKDGTDANSRS